MTSTMHTRFGVTLPTPQVQVALRHLVDQYGLLLDQRDFEALPSLFADDAVLRSGVEARGRAAITQYFKERLQAVDGTFHYVHGHLVDAASRSDANGRTVLSGLVRAHAEIFEERALVRVALHYEDTYVHDGDAWRFLTRTTSQLYRRRVPAESVGDTS